MVFGEIVEPSTRALIIDDDEEYVDYPLDYSFKLDWEGTAAVPDAVNSLIFVESAPILRLFNKDFLKGKIYAEIKNVNVKVYALANNDYLITSNVPETFTHGEVIENFIPWIRKAQNIHCITSKPIPLYITYGAQKDSETFIRSLVYKNGQDFGYGKLESPNLATGIGAAVMSYCVYQNRPSALYIAYVPSAPLDSATAKPVLELLGKLNVFKEGDCKIAIDTASSNLYM